MQESEVRSTRIIRSLTLPTWAIGVIPLILLAALVTAFLVYDPTSPLRAGFPPVEELTVERIAVVPEGLVVHVVNGGPSPVTIAQVLVDEAYWQFTAQPSLTIPRLGRATIHIPYPWVEGEPLEIALITETGLTFNATLKVATLSPTLNARLLGIFALLGVYAGVIPVYLGLLWYPALRRASQHWMHFLLSLTAGLLLFLGVDALQEASELAGQISGAFQGIGLIVIGVVASFLGLTAVGQWTSSSRGAHGEAFGRLLLAYFIALGIGLHNLGEGLAIGAAYSLGELALGSFLVLGFTIHNTTEGLAIVAPVSRDRISIGHLLAMGALAGGPTILGTWFGGFVYSPLLALLFLAIGAGAIFQVVYEVIKLIARATQKPLTDPASFAGLMAGLLIMYLTGLLVVV